MDCPCQSQQEFSNCCEPFIKGRNPETAEQLMRARFSAYSMVNMDYIESTHDPKTRKDTDMKANRDWAQQTKWLGLEIVKTEKGETDDDWGMVEFKARYKNKEGEHFHHEVSEFNRRQGQWFFTNGKHPEARTIINQNPKVGRNDPCICGSGKKYKKCCG